MSDSQLPAVRSETGDIAVPGAASTGAEGRESDGAGRGEGPRAGVDGSKVMVALSALAVGALGILVSLGVASMLGPSVRQAALLSLETGSEDSRPALTDAPEEAARFFAGRDTVHVTVPWDMTVAEFLGLYHLETNPSARVALREQLGASVDGDVLREGDEVTLTLTLVRPGG